MPMPAHAGQRFGKSVDVDDDVAVVGADLDAASGVRVGSVAVFVQQREGLWTPETTLRLPAGKGGERFGAAVAVDDDWIIIGASGDDERGAGAGAVYLATRVAPGEWTELTKLAAPDGTASDRFGAAVAIDERFTVVGSPGEDASGQDSGAAYVFHMVEDGWRLVTKLIPADAAAGDRFGSSVALDSGRVAIGSPRDDDVGIDSGAVYVFVREGSGAWRQEAKLTASNGVAGDRFGASVDLQGGSVVVGAFGSDLLGPGTGAAYVYSTFGGALWREEAVLTPKEADPGDFFGYAVAVDGAMAVVGALDDDDGAVSPGSAFVFRRFREGWRETNRLRPATGGRDDYFGSSVGVSHGRVIVGAVNAEFGGPGSGSAYLFELLAADVNRDGQIDGTDLALLLENWGGRGPGDLNGDGVVDVHDLGLLLRAWTD